MFALEGFIKSGTVANLSLEQLELKFKNYGNTKKPVMGKDIMPFPLNKPATHLTLTWDEKWKVSILLINMNEDDGFKQDASYYAKAVAKEDPEKSEVIKNADRILRVIMSDDPNDDYLSSIGIALTQTLEEWTGCVFVNPKSKKLF